MTAKITLSVVRRADLYLGTNVFSAPQRVDGAMPFGSSQREEQIEAALLAKQGPIVRSSLISGHVSVEGFEKVVKSQHPERNTSQVRPLYVLASPDGMWTVALDSNSDSRRVQARRDVLSPLPMDARAELFGKLAKAYLPTIGGSWAFLPAPLVTSASLVVNLVPVIYRDGQNVAVFSINRGSAIYGPMAIATIGGYVRPEDIGKSPWTPWVTLGRAQSQQLSDSLGDLAVISAFFGVQNDGGFSITVMANAADTNYARRLHEQLRKERLPRDQYAWRSGRYFAVPATLDGLMAAVTAPAPGHNPRKNGQVYQPYEWTSQAGLALDQVVVSYLKDQERAEFRRMTASIELMEGAFMELSDRAPELVNSMLVQLPSGPDQAPTSVVTL